MRIAVLGTGQVGHTIATKLAEIGHEVTMGARSAENPKATAWATEHGGSNGTFAQAAAASEVIFNCTSGIHSLAALGAAGEENLAGKILLDVSNPLDFSKGFPPRLSIGNDDSLGEAIQRAFPRTKVVKTLNTVNCSVMVEPSKVPGAHEVFVSGDDKEARAQVVAWLTEWFGWQAPRDLGGLDTARGTEAWLLLWVRLWGALGTSEFNIRLVTA